MVEKRIKKVVRNNSSIINSDSVPVAGLEVTITLALPGSGSRSSHYVSMKPRVDNIPVGGSMRETIESIFDELYEAMKEKMPQLISDATRW